MMRQQASRKANLRKQRMEYRRIQNIENFEITY